MNVFEKAFLRLLAEENIAGSGGALGNYESCPQGDTYAPGNAQIPFIIGDTRKRKKKKKAPIFRRNIKGL